MLRRGGWAAALGLALSACCDRSSSSPAPSASAVTAASLDLAPPAPPSRCEPAAEGSVVSLGEDRGEDSDGVPFAVEVGQGVVAGEGFAVAALVPDGTRGAKASVVRLGAGAPGSRVIPLMSAHGDTPPPRLTVAGTSLLVGVLESAAGGRRLRLGRVEGESVTWGASLDQARDESLAFDLAASASVALAVWDDEAVDTDSAIKAVAFDPRTLATLGSPRVVSARGTDAEVPRVVPRAGGFWLTWIARRPEKTDEGSREVGESAEYRWLEALPLDERGAPVGAARRVTPETGHVLTYDVRELAGGRALLVYRDDDTPSGSSGGVLMRVVLRPDGAGEPALVSDRQLGIGVPTLLPGWLAMADASAETRLARVGPEGELLDRLESEPVLGRGEPLAARGDELLVLRPRGQGVRLFVTRCRDLPPASDAPGSGRPPAPAAPAARSARPPR